ncbi:unnamed protein product [Ophioblennius macclurei]
MTTCEKWNYEASVSFLGSWGPYQRKQFALLCFLAVPAGFCLLCIIYLLADTPHHCRIPERSNLSQEWMEASIPVEVAGQSVRSSCSRYELDAVRNLSFLGVKPILDLNQSGPGFSPSTLKQEGCRDGWTYDTEYYQSTVVTEFNLVCSDEWRRPLTSLAFFIGGLFGCLLTGRISDRFGRKPAMFGAIGILSISSVAMAFAPSWPVFTVLFFLLGMGQISSYIVVFVLGSELMIGETRILFSSLCLPFAYVFASLLMTCSAHLVRNWRFLSLIMAVPGLACVPIWWLISESPRWLLSQGRLQEAECLLRSAARQNRVEPPSVIFASRSVEKVQSQKSESLGFMDLLKATNIRNISVILWIIWFSVNISYFGVALNSSSLSGNPYLNYFLLSVVELPAYAGSCLAARRLPRRLSFILSGLLGSVALLLIQVTLHCQPAVTLSLVLIGKFGVVISAGILYIYTGELSPTGIRNTAMCACATFARVGSALSPYLMQLAVFNQFLPWIFVGGLSLLSVVLCFFLPETFRQALPDTIQQVPQAKFRLSCFSKNSPTDDKVTVKDLCTPHEIVCSTHL